MTGSRNVGAGGGMSCGGHSRTGGARRPGQTCAIPPDNGKPHRREKHGGVTLPPPFGVADSTGAETSDLAPSPVDPAQISATQETVTFEVPVEETADIDGRRVAAERTETRIQRAESLAVRNPKEEIGTAAPNGVTGATALL